MRTTATDGVVLVDKPPGMTSHDVVAVARRALGTRRIGHTGTLDPFATGLLVLLVGRGTRLAAYVEDEPKVYDATIAFGSETTTDDLTGEVTRVAGPPSESDIDAAIQSLTGTICQRPPDYSAKKLAGTRAYAAARGGTPLELTPVPVSIYEWRVRRRTTGAIEVTIACGGGTYVRALARDLGRIAGSAAHLTALRRTRSGVFDVGGSVSLADLESKATEVIAPLSSAIPHLPTQVLTPDELRRVQHGNSVDARVEAPIAALLDDDGNLVGLARLEGRFLHPRVVLKHE